MTKSTGHKVISRVIYILIARLLILYDKLFWIFYLHLQIMVSHYILALAIIISDYLSISLAFHT